MRKTRARGEHLLWRGPQRRCVGLEGWGGTELDADLARGWGPCTCLVSVRLFEQTWLTAEKEKLHVPHPHKLCLGLSEPPEN